jgi:GNAT superfamily N-acetyltransferase
VYPSLAFDSLFENRGSLRYQSVLDRVKDRAGVSNRPDPRGVPAARPRNKAAFREAISCFYVRKGYRRRGVTSALIARGLESRKAGEGARARSLSS